MTKLPVSVGGFDGAADHVGAGESVVGGGGGQN